MADSKFQEGAPPEQVAMEEPKRPPTSSSKEKTIADSDDGPQLQSSPPEATSKEGQTDYISGAKLVFLMSCITFICFLMLLDTSVLGTVRYPLPTTLPLAHRTSSGTTS